MKLKDALLLVNAIADEGSETYQEQYNNGNVAKAIKIVDNFIDFLKKNT
jgi:hypothetical protein